MRVAACAWRLCGVLLQLCIVYPARGRPAAAGVAQQVAPRVRALRLRRRRGHVERRAAGVREQVGLLPARMADPARQQVCQDPAAGVPCLSTAGGFAPDAGRTSSPPAGGSPGPAAPSHPEPACHDSSAAGPSLSHAAAQSSTWVRHSMQIVCWPFAEALCATQLSEAIANSLSRCSSQLPGSPASPGRVGRVPKKTHESPVEEAAGSCLALHLPAFAPTTFPLTTLVLEYYSAVEGTCLLDVRICAVVVQGATCKHKCCEDTEPRWSQRRTQLHLL